MGFAETDITPPDGFPIAGYFHERLASGQIDPLKARAVVFRGNGQQSAIVGCDLTGISVDLSSEVRKLASERTGIPAENIVLTASHSHTAPDYYKSLFISQSKGEQQELRATYVLRLIDQIATAIENAHRNCSDVRVAFGVAEQKEPVSFNRRFVMKDGSVRTWMNLMNPDVVRAAGPIDPEIGLVTVRNSEGQPIGVISSFALHLDTVGGLKWSADYPYFIEQSLRKSLGADVVSVFGTGCCGDINHSNPAATERNKTDFIGTSLANTITKSLGSLNEVTSNSLQVRHAVVDLPIQDATPEGVAKAIDVMKQVASGQQVDFFDHVTAHKTLLADRMKNKPSIAKEGDPGSLLYTHTWAGIGETLPAEVHTVTIGDDIAIVCLPGEVFVELGLAIKRNSPFRTTLVMELSNSVESCYIPTRAAYAVGSYEVTNSTVKPGSGEMLVEASLKLLRDSATANRPKP
ncbi:MAG: neutral/alkaline non-lysosomal ceramidase N-terminal domain-containing protein [Planctomyces sp.]|nr:neutral/alkaline non-lysosomal ceramidase N-terminal domain-containing protein [Planctomyces sp.]